MQEEKIIHEEIKRKIKKFANRKEKIPKKMRDRRIEENPLLMIALNTDFNENSYPYFKYSSIGNLFEEDTCSYCHAFKWAKETPGFCCYQGNIKLETVRDPPDVIEDLLTNKEFTNNIRGYNNAFALASLGTKHKQEIGPNFKIQGKLLHTIGSLAPVDGDPKFAQLYFYDSDSELENRLKKVETLKREILEKFQFHP